MDQALVDAAVARFSLKNAVSLAPTGQKFVATADAAGGPVVLKLIELSPPHAAVALERARREVKVLSTISHRHVVKLVSDLEEIDSPPRAVCWLEEQLDGQDLVHELGPRRTWADTAAMATDVLDGLSAFHDAGVVHRDLSAKNIRHRADGSYTVMDPGLARLIAVTTITGPMDPGTPGFMSPEHVSANVHPTFASDVFCVGILSYAMLTGELPIPFTGDRNTYATELRDTQAPPVSVKRPDLEARQSTYVDTCLQRQLARRYLDAGEARAALLSL